MYFLIVECSIPNTLAAPLIEGNSWEIFVLIFKTFITTLLIKVLSGLGGKSE